MEYQLHDVVMMKKPHACGVNRWQITRMGAEMRIQCEGCQREVSMTRHDFNKRFKRVLEAATQTEE